MFSVRQDKQTDSYILTPKWNKETERNIVFSAFRVIDSDPYVIVVFDECTVAECNEWVKKGESGDYVPVVVKDAVVQLKLLSKEAEVYQKKVYPNKWDEFLIGKFKEMDSSRENGKEFSGFVDCGQKNNSLLDVYQRTDSVPTKEALATQLYSFCEVSDFSGSPSFNKLINSLKSGGSSGGYRQQNRRSLREMLQDALDFYSENLSLYLFDVEDKSLAASVEKIHSLQGDDRIKADAYVQHLKNVVRGF